MSVYNYIHRVDTTFVSIQLHTPGRDYISQYTINYTGWRFHLSVYNYIHPLEIPFVSIQLHAPGDLQSVPLKNTTTTTTTSTTGGKSTKGTILPISLRSCSHVS